jgi:cGMP-dependent protein kinase
MNSLKEQKFKNGQIILKDGPKSEEFYYIFNGEVNLNINGIDLKTLSKGKSFGDISSAIITYPQKTNFISKNQTILFSIDKDTYNDIVNKSDFYLRLRRIIDKNDNSISLQNLFYLTELGRGSFGKVYLVHNKQKLFALKTTQIEVISENKEYASLVLNEKTIMSQVDHPFIVRLKNTFKTKDFIFFLMEYINGMNMRKYLELKEKKELRKLDEAQFFGGILFTVLHYLSKRKIIHRDLKPDNLMMNKNGYIKVIDFGVAKYLRGKDYTNTVTGTPHYMSPEVILGKPYSFEVDYWSVGIILYEIFYGMVPFGYATDSINEIYKEILECNLHLPSDPKNENFNNLIKCLLYKISSNRISVFSSVKNHIFFKDFDFEDLLKFNYEAPCKPGNNLISGNEDDLIKNENVPFLNFMQNNIFQSVSDIDENFLKTASDSMLSKF